MEFLAVRSRGYSYSDFFSLALRLHLGKQLDQ